MLDTNVAIALRDGDPSLSLRLKSLGDVCLSVISRVELEGGLAPGVPDAALRRARLETVLSGVQLMSFDGREVSAYAGIIAKTGFSRKKILDRMIAAHALVHDATLVTANMADFRDVPGLKLLAW